VRGRNPRAVFFVGSPEWFPDSYLV
jgi:hypothetical protein